MAFGNQEESMKWQNEDIRSKHLSGQQNKAANNGRFSFNYMGEFERISGLGKNDGKGGARLRGPQVQDREAIPRIVLRAVYGERGTTEEALRGSVACFGSEFPAVSGCESRGDTGNRDGKRN
jgi:hypothetical protein